MANTPQFNVQITRGYILKRAFIPQSILLLISILWILIFPKDNVLKYLEFNLSYIFYGAIIGLILAFLGYGFYYTCKKTKKFIPAIELFENILAPVFKILKTQDALLLSCVSGFCEEVFFRGLLFPKVGIIISSIAFGILHLPSPRYWIYALWASLSGALFAYLLLESNSLWIPITAHVINNFTGMILLHKIGKD